MKKKRSAIVCILILMCFNSLIAQKLNNEEMFKQYFITHIDSLDHIEGIWNVNTEQQFFRYDTLYEERKYPKAAKVAIIKRNGKYDSFNLTGESYNVEFLPTEVQGVFLYKNNFIETGSSTKTSAVISKNGTMEYTYDFPDDYLRYKFDDSYEEGTKVTNHLIWNKVFPEKNAVK
jgi:hypothetical protein